MEFPRNSRGNIGKFSGKCLGKFTDISLTFPGNFPDISQNFTGNLLENYRKFHRNFPHISQQKFTGNLSEIPRKFTRNSQETFRFVVGTFPGHFLEMSRKFPADVHMSNGKCLASNIIPKLRFHSSTGVSAKSERKKPCGIMDVWFSYAKPGGQPLKPYFASDFP